MTDDLSNGHSPNRRMIVIGVSLGLVILIVAVGGFYSAILFIVTL